MSNQSIKASLIGLSLFSAQAWGQIANVTYFPPSGSGCNPDDSELIATGSDFYWNLGLTLNLPPAGSGNRYCAMRAGLELLRGYYPTEIWQEITFSANKSRDGAILSLSSSHTLFGYSSQPKEFNYPSGTPFQEPSKTLAWTTDLRFIPQSYWCAADRNPKGLWTARIAINGLIENPNAYLVFGPDGKKTTYRWKFMWARCPGF
ncbi:MAG TPA: hypothetical protein VFO10_05390 [Oligoflexus sp.]|uniref:hypothetical protein n=1 Tax=Oligoflexus sp. TaxID=1971216 RepID=UPI002D7F732D|nr:hypothetical protein [Oligoflexus sp.]HET9236659.1 hypothetical protein [Oligoflexus sp.]